MSYIFRHFLDKELQKIQVYENTFIANSYPCGVHENLSGFETEQQ